MKRIFAAVVTLSLMICLTGCGSGPVYNPDRWQYDPDTRVVLSERSAFDTMEPTVRNNAIVADVIIKGIVKDDGQVLTTDFAGNDRLPESNRFSLSSTVFQVEVAGDLAAVVLNIKGLTKGPINASEIILCR